MSAEEVLAAAFSDAEVECDWTPEGHAGHALAALKAGGFAVVEISHLRTKAHIERIFAQRAGSGEPDVPRHPDYYLGRAFAYDSIANKALEARP